MKKILLVTDGLVHPPLIARNILRKTLAALDAYTFSHVRSLEKLPDDLETYAAMVLYFHHKDISEAALMKLDSFVTAGGGLLGIHSASASFKEVPHYFEILGGMFTDHGPVEKFSVTPVRHSEIFSGIPAFEVVDELYVHKMQPGIQVHFTVKHKGEDIPAVWTNLYGEGRVLYAVPGHTTKTLRNRTYKKFLQQGLIWVTNA